MNLVRHYIKEIHSVEDITNNFTKHYGYEPYEPLLEVELTYDCYGVVKRDYLTFWKSNFERAKKQGWFKA